MSHLILIFLLIFGCSSEPAPDQSRSLPFVDVSADRIKSSATTNNSMDGHVVDIDDDGDPDLIIAMEFRRNVILINDGMGVLEDQSSTRFPNSSHDSEDITVSDFDHDGDPDIVFVSEDDRTNEFYLNDGSGKFENVSLPVSGTTNAVETTDLNGDGLDDLILGNAGQNFILINTGGAFTDETTARLPINTATTQDIELADIDGDGDLDLAEANESQNRILINDGSGVFTHRPQALPEVSDQTRDVDFGDVDGDGDPDLFFSNVDFGGIGNPQNRLLLNDGTGTFSDLTATHLPSSNFRTVDSDFVDIDQDGDLDLLTGNRWNGNRMMVLINSGDGHFEDQSDAFLPALQVYPFDFQVADFNRDGKIDIYICSFQGQDVMLTGN